MSVNSTSPSTLFGGTWEQLKDRFLLGSGSTYTAGNTGGEATHTLTTNEMPKHTHTWTQSSCTNPGGHTHDITVDAYNFTSTECGAGGVWKWTAENIGGNRASGSDKGHTHTIAGINANTGGSGAHNNMPPYFVVYMWKRTK